MSFYNGRYIQYLYNHIAIQTVKGKNVLSNNFHSNNIVCLLFLVHTASINEFPIFRDHPTVFKPSTCLFFVIRQLIKIKRLLINL